MFNWQSIPTVDYRRLLDCDTEPLSLGAHNLRKNHATMNGHSMDTWCEEVGLQIGISSVCGFQAF